MHASPSDVGFAVRSGSTAIAAGADVRFVGFGLGSSLGPVQRRRGDEVLDDGAVHDELVRRALRSSRGRLGNDILEDRVLILGLGVNVGYQYVGRGLFNL